MLWSGIVLALAGAFAFFAYVLPRVGGEVSGPPLLAVVIATVGLAVGAALIGIGLGRWKRPRPSPDGSAEV